MRKKVGSLPAGAIFLIAAVTMGSSAALAQAEDSCLKTPNGHAPAGSRWYYHTDPVTKDKCWSIKPIAQTAQPAAERPAAAQAPPLPRPAPAARDAAEPTAAPDSPAWPAAGQQGAQQPDAATTVWPAAPSAPASTATTTPEEAVPGSPDQSAPPPATAAPEETPPAPAAATGQPNSPSPATPVQAAQDKPQNNPQNNPQDNSQDNSKDNSQDKPPIPPDNSKAVAVPVKPVTSVESRVPLAMLLAGFIGLLAIGMLLRRLVAMMFGRPQGGIRVSRQEPRLRGGNPAMLRLAPSLVPGQAETEHRISEIEDALRHLAQRMRERNSTSLGNISKASGTDARARS